MSYKTATLKAVTATNPEVKQLQFELGEAWDYRPGQHTVIRFEDDEGEVERPYTMINRPSGRRVCLSIKRYEDGRATPWIHSLEPGDRVELAEPSGNLYINDYSKDAVFISTGTGATPMYAMLRDYLQNGEGRAFYFHGEKTREHLLFKQELENLEAENPGLDLFFSVTREEWPGLEGYIQEHVPERIDLEGKDFYICGVPAMVVQTEKKLEDEGVEEDRIFTEGWEKDAS